MIRRLAILAAFLFVPLVAHASTSSCDGVGDGTACTTQCISAGTCKGNACVPTTVRPNGSTCSSENNCTINDTCQNGECVSGGAITCPSLDACNVGECIPSVGCVIVDQCRPDLSTPLVDMAPPDFSGVILDMTSSGDQGILDLSSAPHDLTTVVTDACFTPPGTEFPICPFGDGFIVVGGGDLAHGADMPDMAERYGHLRGSRPGDCDVTPGSRTTSPIVLGLVACALLRLRRRRA